MRVVYLLSFVTLRISYVKKLLLFYSMVDQKGSHIHYTVYLTDFTIFKNFMILSLWTRAKYL